MFDEVTKQEGGKNAARKGAFVLGSSVLQALVVLAIITISARIAAKVTEAPIDVKFIRARGAPPPPPPPPPPPKKKKTPDQKAVVKAAPGALIQPKEIPTETKAPEPSSADDEDDDGVEGGVEGGVKGGVVGGVIGGTLGGTVGGVEEAPVYVTAGFKKPSLEDPSCVGNSVRIPKDLQGIVTKVTVKFAVGKDGTTDLFQFMTQVPDKRIEEAIRSAISGCKWVPGADAQGHPTRIWVILPIQMKGS